MKGLKRWLVCLMAAVLMMSNIPFWGLLNTLGAEVSVLSDKIPQGKTGKTMNVSFVIRNTSGSDLRDLCIGFDVMNGEILDESEDDIKYGYAFPFEVTTAINNSDKPKDIGSLGAHKERSVSLSAKVRRDLPEGYYNVPVTVWRKTGGGLDTLAYGEIRIWITKSTGSDKEEDDDTKTYDFVLGEGQDTPDGTYPNVLNFALNLRNNSTATVYAVKARLVLESDTTKFPFEINDANYDKRFDKLEPNETVPLDYSFAIRSDAYTGYYPINMKIDYSTSSTGDVLETYETSFFVRVRNKEKEDDKGDFNANDRTKARLVVDGFSTSPETIVAGEEFDLTVRIKNASSNISASNILLSLESEKVTESAVFTTESGSSSVAIDSLGAGASRDIKVRLASKPGIDQRSYGLTIKAKFDSPEFKNAEESMIVDIPIRQVARLNTSTFDIMPDAIDVGGESNIMFGINNTGKVMLYNVMVKFEANSIQTTDTYVGNIKPGETGNVDAMVTGIAPTQDDGVIKLTISYENEMAEVSTEEKELRLTVSEEMPDEGFDVGNFEDIPMKEPSVWIKYKKILILAGIGAAVVVFVLVMVKVKKAKKRISSLEEDEDDEIS